MKLYYGTRETTAKSSPIRGIPSLKEGITLTSCYAAYQSYKLNQNITDRLAIVELDQLSNLESDWNTSIDLTGFCIHKGSIPAASVKKVWVFNPSTNWMISRTIAHIDPEQHQVIRKKLDIINRWLTGDFVLLDDWLGDQKELFSKEQRNQMSNLWSERSGLDLFYNKKE